MALLVKNPPTSAGDIRDGGLVGKIPWRRAWQPTPALLPGDAHGWGSLVGYSPRGREELNVFVYSFPKSVTEL